jgi:hypothetical protein
LKKKKEKLIEKSKADESEQEGEEELLSGDDSVDETKDDNDGDEDYDDVDPNEIPAHANQDGFAQMLSKILNQNVDKNKIVNPVLAKRKTSIMKELEANAVDKERVKELRKERELSKKRQLVIPDVSTANYERQLKKLATKGVVSLFNAVAKLKREEAAEEQDDDNNKNSSASKNSSYRNDDKQQQQQMKKGIKDLDKNSLHEGN